MGESQEQSMFRRFEGKAWTGEYVLICVGGIRKWPLHLGHVAGCYLPPDTVLLKELEGTEF